MLISLSKIENRSYAEVRQAELLITIIFLTLHPHIIIFYRVHHYHIDVSFTESPNIVMNLKTIYQTHDVRFVYVQTHQDIRCNKRQYLFAQYCSHKKIQKRNDTYYPFISANESVIKACVIPQRNLRNEMSQYGCSEHTDWRHRSKKHAGRAKGSNFASLKQIKEIASGSRWAWRGSEISGAILRKQIKLQ